MRFSILTILVAQCTATFGNIKNIDPLPGLLIQLNQLFFDKYELVLARRFDAEMQKVELAPLVYVNDSYPFYPTCGGDRCTSSMTGSFSATLKSSIESAILSGSSMPLSSNQIEWKCPSFTIMMPLAVDAHVDITGLKANGLEEYELAWEDNSFDAKSSFMFNVATGRPELYLTSLDVSVNGPRIQSHNCSTQAYCCLIECFGIDTTVDIDQYRLTMENAIRSIITHLLIENTNDYLKRMKVEFTMPVHRNYRFDYGFTAFPNSTDKFVQFLFDGTVYNDNGHTTTIYSTKPGELQPTVGVQMNFQLPDKVFKSFVGALHYDAYFEQLIDDPLLQKHNFGGYLNTSCALGDGCIGDVIPAIGSQYPNQQVYIKPQLCDLVPNATISIDDNDGLQIRWNYKFLFKVDAPKDNNLFAMAVTCVSKAPSSRIRVDTKAGNLILIDFEPLSTLSAPVLVEPFPHDFEVTDDNLKSIWINVLVNIIDNTVHAFGAAGIPLPGDQATFPLLNPVTQTYYNSILINADVDFDSFPI